MRSLISIYYFSRLLIHMVTIDQIPPKVGFSLLVFIYTACSMLIVLAQLYKKKYMNITDILILALLSFILSQQIGDQSNSSIVFFYTIGSILASIPLIALIGVLIGKMIRKIMKLPCCKRLLQLSQSNHNMRQNDEDDDLLTQNSDSHKYHEFRH